jgi:hypothetical protein
MRWQEIIESKDQWMELSDLHRIFPELGETRDVEKSIQWFSGFKMANCVFSIKQEHLDVFRNQAEEMLATYDEFPKEKSRTYQILKRLKHGERPLPIFIEYGDPQKFIIEGRHRIVAFMQMGLKYVTVVTVKPLQTD